MRNSKYLSIKSRREERGERREYFDIRSYRSHHKENSNDLSKEEKRRQRIERKRRCEEEKTESNLQLIDDREKMLKKIIEEDNLVQTEKFFEYFHR